MSPTQTKIALTLALMLKPELKAKVCKPPRNAVRCTKGVPTHTDSKLAAFVKEEWKVKAAFEVQFPGQPPERRTKRGPRAGQRKRGKGTCVMTSVERRDINAGYLHRYYRSEQMSKRENWTKYPRNRGINLPRRPCTGYFLLHRITNSADVNL